MTYEAAAKQVSTWLQEHRITAPRSEPLRLTDVLGYLRPYWSEIDSQILAKLRIIPGCKIRDDSTQYLPLSLELSTGAETGYAFSKKAESRGGHNHEVFGYQWMITYGGNAFRIRLFAVTNNQDSKLSGVEVHARVVHGKSHDDLIAQMCSVQETQDAIRQIQSALQTWMLRIRQEMPMDTEPTNASF